ncbi:MAG TPA: methylenetetrahydrofolate reductase [NAD(P)H] [Alphaproteobacteria bacterium]|nr:methylenetetrahydrofolate reductase [NAD(P)H] [Alphaproteobacteria bacterium]
MSSQRPTVSFEFFPPKTEPARAQLWDAVGMLARLKPDFMTVTYGAGGSTREWTIQTAEKILQDTKIPTAAHLTCVCTPKEEIHRIAGSLWNRGIRHIVALRGDAPKDGAVPAAEDPEYYHYADELVAGLKFLRNFEISVAAYPEKHPAAPDLKTDIENLRRKCEAGADRAITQFFFDNEKFYRFRDVVSSVGIAAPLVAGILPIANPVKAFEFARKCGASIPDRLAARFEGLENDHDTARLVAAVVLAEQIADLRANGVDHFHFYTLNQAHLTYAACQGLRM